MLRQITQLMSIEKSFQLKARAMSTSSTMLSSVFCKNRCLLKVRSLVIFMPAPQLSKITLQSGRRKAQRKRPRHFPCFAFVWLTSDKHLPDCFCNQDGWWLKFRRLSEEIFAGEKRSPQVLSEMTLKCNTAVGALAPSPPISMLNDL